MKYLVLIILAVSISNFSWSQDKSNKQRLAELPELIESEAAKENYDEAAKLQKELEIREQLETALKDKDYKKAAQHREELNVLEKTPARSTNQSVQDNNTPPPPVANPTKKNSFFYLDLTLAGMNIYAYDQTVFTDIFDENGYYIGSQETVTRQREIGYAINIKLGNKFYFGSPERSFRVGVDVNYASINIGFLRNSNSLLPNINFSIARPGIVLTYNLTPSMGLDFQFNGGLMFFISPEFNPNPVPVIGYSFNPQLKYWFKKIGVGLEYNFGVLPATDMNFSHAGLSFGFRL